MTSLLPTRLYHGTTVDRLDSILKHGLLPRAQQVHGESVWPDNPSKAEFVYLTLAHALYYALAARNTREGLPAPVLLEIDGAALRESHLAPDEDALIQGCGDVEAMRSLARRIDLEQERGLWQMSLDTLGNIAHKGSVPVGAIRRYVTVDYDRAPSVCHLAADASIGAESYQFCGAHHRSLIQHLFDSTPIAFDIDALLPTERIKERDRALQEERERGVRLYVTGA